MAARRHAAIWEKPAFSCRRPIREPGFSQESTISFCLQGFAPPFASGARILSQAAKELAAFPSSAREIVSVCADGGEGAVALLERA